jgi:geranylgeranyl diphosphate synthase type II
MHSFEELSSAFSTRFDGSPFPASPSGLYDPATYFLGLGGKRIRPVLCLMGNELFDEITEHAWNTAMAIELFHNFTLIHDDIMDKAPIRRGMQTVHSKFGEPSALLAGDVMLVFAYDYLNKIPAPAIHRIIDIFNRTAREVCEGQEIDMEFERLERVGMDQYLHMIGLKTSVLIAASLQMGAVLGGGGKGNQQLIYQFGKNLGLAFQLQDDYLDVFGDPAKFGKQRGGDIMANKKTFLLIKALDTASPEDRRRIQSLMAGGGPGKVEKMIEIFRSFGVDVWARELKETYFNEALNNLEDIAVLSSRKNELRKLAALLMNREH